jgi:hypothetical protein
MQRQSALPVRRPDTTVQLPARLQSLGWGLLSLVGFVVSGYAGLLPSSSLEGLIGLPHISALGLWAILTTVGGGLLALGAARLVFGAWPRVPRGAWLVLAAGAGVSAAQIVVQAAWSLARFGTVDPQLVGPTYLFFLVDAGVAIAGFGVLVAPRRAIWSPVVAVFAGVLLAIALAFANVHGLADGLAAGSELLLGAMVISALYIAAIGTLALVRLWARD